MSPWRVAPLQSLSSDAITDSAASKSGGGWAGKGWVGGLLPARLALYVFKSSALLMGLNGADWAVWESAGVCLDFFCSCRFDVSVDVGFLRNVANAVF